VSCRGKSILGRDIGPGRTGDILKAPFAKTGAERGVRGPLQFLHRSNEAEALAWQSLDQTLLFAGVAKHITGDIQTCRQGRIGHDAAVPDGVDEVVLTHDSVPVADQIIEQVEYLWRNLDCIRPAIKLAKVGVEFVLLKMVAQAGNSLGDFSPSQSLAPVATQE